MQLQGGVGRFTFIMHSQRPSAGDEAVESLDRRIIQVDVPPAHAGITAALRRAFAPAGRDPCNQDFSELLQRLN